MRDKDYLDFIAKTHVAQTNLDTLLLLTNRINELGGIVKVKIDFNGAMFQVLNHNNTINEVVKTFMVYKYREDEEFEKNYNILCSVYEELTKEDY